MRWLGKGFPRGSVPMGMTVNMNKWAQFVPSQTFISSQTLMFECEGTAIGHMRKVSDETVRMVALAIHLNTYDRPKADCIGAVRALMCWNIPASFYAYGEPSRALDAFKAIMSGEALDKSFEGLAAMAIQTLRLNPELTVEKVLAGE